MSTEKNHTIDTTIGTVNDPSANDNIINLYSTTHFDDTQAEYKKIQKSFDASTATSQCEQGNHMSQGTI